MSDSPDVPARYSIFDRIRGAMLLLLIAFGGFVLYYSLFFERKTTYLRDRNARLIAFLGNQIRRSIDATGRIVESGASLSDKELNDVYTFRRGLSEQRAPQAVFDEIKLLKPEEAPTANHHFAAPYNDTLRLTFERGIEKKGIPPATTNLAALLAPPPAPAPPKAKAPKADAAKAEAPKAPEKIYARGTIELRRLIDNIVRQAATGVFDTVFILDRDGDVIYQWTRQSDSDSEASLKIVRLSSLQAPRLMEKEVTLQASELMSSSRQMPVRIGDRRYQLFSVPLRTSVHIEDEAHGAHAAEAKADAKAEPGIPEDTWAVCGAVANSDFRSRSLAISATLLCILGACALLMIFSWPFLKLGLSSPQHRVTLGDVLLLGVSGVLAAAVLCLAFLDGITFSKLEDIANEHLEIFSNRIEANLGAEIFSAQIQLDAAQDWIEEALDAGSDVTTRGANVLARRDGDKHPFPEMTRPFFQQFFLIGEDGKQKVKFTTDKQVTPLVSALMRTYFSGPMVKGRDYREIDGRRITIESVRSTTTGQPEVVFARRTDERQPPRKKDNLREKLPVIAMSLPTAPSLVQPVLPEGFGFAIIDDTGKVLFHSNSERNTIENFFAETDENPQVRSAVAARQRETINLRYLGDDYTAHIRPMRDLPWTLITFRVQDNLRSLNTEALLITLIFLLVLAAASIVAVLLTLLFRPRYRAEWLWPDARRVAAYAELAASYLFLLAVAAVLLLTLRGSSLLLFPFWFVPLVLAIAYLVLRSKATRTRRVIATAIAAICAIALLVQVWTTDDRPIVPAAAASLLLILVAIRAALRREEAPNTERRRERQIALPLCYTWTASLLLLLISVVPSTAFFKAAYEMEIDNYVKRMQMKVAGDLQSRWWRVKAEFSRERGEGKERYESDRWEDTLDVYAKDIFATNVDFDGKPGKIVAAADTTPMIPPFVEAMLPHYATSPVSTRELVHDRAADNLWWWKRKGHRLDLVMNNRAEKPFIISSVVPQLLPTMNNMGFEEIGASPALLVVVGVLVVLLAAFTMARFIARRVFLVDLVQPLAAAQGYVGLRHVICHPCDDKSARRLFKEFKTIDLSTEEGLAEAATAPQSFKLYEPAVFIDGVNHSFAIGERSELLRGLLERLTRNTDRTVVLRPSSLNVVTRSYLLGADREAWAARLTSFVWVNWSQLDTSDRRVTLSGPAVPFEDEPSGRWSWRGLYALIGFRKYFEQLTDMRGTIRRTLRAETDGDPYLHTLVTSLSDDATNRDQVLDEIGERAEEYYGALWRTCSREEQLVLMQLSQTGLANSKARKHVRRLLARGHLKRDPQLRVMNETFRRFVLTQAATSKIARELEHDIAGDAWSKFRVPFFASVAVVLLFFFMTQRQMFDSTIALITGLAASLPAFLKMVGGLGSGDRAKSER